MATRKKKFDLSKLNLNTKIFIIIAVIIAIAIILSGVPQTAQFYASTVSKTSTVSLQKGVYSVTMVEMPTAININIGFGASSSEYTKVKVVATDSKGSVVVTKYLSASGTATLEVAKTAFPIQLTYYYNNIPMHTADCQGEGMAGSIYVALCPSGFKPITTINYMLGQSPSVS